MRIASTLLVVWLIFSSAVLAAEVVTNAKPMVVEFVDNQAGEIVVNDQKYYLRLNTKVSNTNNRKLNRYALKVGQSVKMKTSFEKKKYYANAIVIISN